MPLYRTSVRTIPVALVAAVISLYWWRVLRMAYKMRRKTGRAANFVPTEPLGRLLRMVWQPVVWIWIALPWWALLGFHAPWIFRPLPTPPALVWAAAGVAVTAYFFTRLAWKRMGRSWRMGIDPAETTQLVFTGPFAYVRHPIYALSSLLILATVAAVPAPLMFGAAIAHLFLLQWEARREEYFLSQLHGEPYLRYLHRVGRFVPTSLQPFRPEAPDL